MKDAEFGHEEKLKGKALAFYQACEGLVERGFFVFPVRRDKQPFTPSGFKDATRDLRQIYVWAQDHPDAQPAIACEMSGLLVIDVDDIDACCSFLASKGYELPDTLSAVSPSGGRHHYFQAPKGANPPGHLCDGVDIKFKGYVLAPPATAYSKRAGAEGAYKWLNAHTTIAPLPEWPELSSASPASVPVVSGCAARVTTDLYAEMKELLSYIPQDVSYNHWIKVLTNIHEASNGSLEGMKIADTWSAKGVKYKPDDVKRRWPGFRLGEAGGMGALALMAQSHGADIGEIGRRYGSLTPMLADLEGIGEIDVSSLLAGHSPASLAAPGTPSDLQPDVWARIKARADTFNSSIIRGDQAVPVLDLDYLVKGWLGRGDLSMLYGPSNVGKSFIALDIANQVAKGESWNGYSVCGGPVIYFAAEGGRSLQNRLVALRGGASEDLHLVPEAADLYQSDVDIAAIIQLVRDICDGTLGMIVFDTLARSMSGGDENTGVDMGQVINRLDYIRAQTGAHVMLVHHTGKDLDRGARGHSSLRAAVDTELACQIKDGDRVFVATKQRDMETGEKLFFELEPYSLGTDADGDEKTTCFVEFKPASERTAAKKVVGKNQKTVLECATMLIKKSGERVECTSEGKEVWIGVRKDALLEQAASQMGKVSEKANKRAAKDALSELLRRKELIEVGSHVCLPASNDSHES
jgi:hypothetical protein